jgi:hypothetical protein
VLGWRWTAPGDPLVLRHPMVHAAALAGDGGLVTAGDGRMVVWDLIAGQPRAEAAISVSGLFACERPAQSPIHLAALHNPAAFSTCTVPDEA